MPTHIIVDEFAQLPGAAPEVAVYRGSEPVARFFNHSEAREWIRRREAFNRLVQAVQS